MKLFWTGTDTLMLLDLSQRKLLKKPYWLIFRIIVKILDRFCIEGHFTNSELLKRDLQKFGVKKPIEIHQTPLLHSEAYPKIRHDGFNVLYYCPPRSDPKFRDWLYGIDLIRKLKKALPQINFFCADKSLDMAEVYPLMDFYIRPNRHDGNSRMIRECEIQNIAYYWSNENPDYFEMTQAIEDEYRRKLINEAIRKVEGLS